MGPYSFNPPETGKMYIVKMVSLPKVNWGFDAKKKKSIFKN